MTKRFGAFTALDRGLAQGAGRQLPCPAGRERRRQEHAGQMHHGLLPAGHGRRPGRRPRTGDREPARGARARPRHGLPALHLGPGHDGDGEFRAGPLRAAGGDRLAHGDEGAGSLSRPHAVSRAARRQGVGDLRRRAAEMRNPQAALSRAPVPHPRRADLGAHARRGRRGAGHAARHGAARRAHHPDDHPQVPRGHGVRGRGHHPAARPSRRLRARRRADAGCHGGHDDRRAGADHGSRAQRRHSARRGSRSMG